MKKLLKLMQTLSAGDDAGAKELRTFVDVFFTEKEREMLVERLQIFEELARGATQREVAAKIGCSVVTVMRGAKAYRQYQAVIDRWLGALRTSK